MIVSETTSSLNSNVPSTKVSVLKLDLVTWVTEKSTLDQSEFGIMWIQFAT